ncbi:MAG: methyltransferase, FxLD system [Actinomycetota bacterium]|nr:methyltransferase, FxLD system [Actinomycetota bacterium]
MATDTAREGVHSDQDVDELRDAMVDEVIVDREWVGLVPREVEAALRTVPRHLFAPEVSLEEAYADRSIVTKRTEHGASISSVTAPHTQAMMLGQLQVAPGQRVLEIGSGGYNAALLRELVGPEGSVTTLDIDPEIADRAQACLTTAGYRDVRVVCADGEPGAPEYGPFDRIIVTVGTWDIPPAWVEQLAEGGRLVVPLRTKGLNLSWTLEHAGGYLVGCDPMPCGFVPMQGLGKNRSRSISLHGGEASLWVGEQQVDATALSEVFSTPRAQAWSGVTVRKRENFNDLDLWLARLPGFYLLSVTQDAVDRGLVSPTWPMSTPALVDRGSSLAYRAKLRPVDTDGTVRELGAYAHGPNAAEAAERFVEQIRIWDRDHRHGPGPRLPVHPVGTPDAELPSGLVVDRRHTRMAISWPDLTDRNYP